MFKAVVKIIALLAILFVMLYVGLNNPQEIAFNFPVAGTTDKAPLRANAAIIFFVIFAVGILAGTLLHFGSSGGDQPKGGGSSRKSSKDR